MTKKKEEREYAKDMEYFREFLEDKVLKKRQIKNYHIETIMYLKFIWDLI